MSSRETTRAQYTGVRHLGPLGGASLVLGFLFHNARFSVVAASPDDDGGKALVPVGYDFDESIEGRILNEIYDLSSHDSDNLWPQGNQEASSRLRRQLADLAADACLSTMQQFAPTPTPAAQTLQDFLYPRPTPCKSSPRATSSHAGRSTATRAFQSAIRPSPPRGYREWTSTSRLPTFASSSLRRSSWSAISKTTSGE